MRPPEAFPWLRDSGVSRWSAQSVRASVRNAEAPLGGGLANGPASQDNAGVQGHVAGTAEGILAGQLYPRIRLASRDLGAPPWRRL